MKKIFLELKRWLGPVFLIVAAVWMHNAHPSWDFEIRWGVGLVQFLVFLAAFLWVGQKGYVMYINILRVKQGKDPVSAAQLETESQPEPQTPAVGGEEKAPEKIDDLPDSFPQVIDKR